MTRFIPVRKYLSSFIVNIFDYFKDWFGFHVFSASSAQHFMGSITHKDMCIRDRLPYIRVYKAFEVAFMLLFIHFTNRAKFLSQYSLTLLG